jgi:peptidoglycan/LPS O-acetylase OafA/YrhL
MVVDQATRLPATTSEQSVERTYARVPALDGIRAIAIVAVLVFHNYSFEGFRHWGGGFLGVDVFFVLSGFLITTLLLREHDRTDRVDLRQFWTRRARRLLPAVFVLILLEAVVALFVLDARSASALRGDAIGSLFYFENWRVATGAATAASHTWSLAVEEQWYLIWPLLLVGLLFLARGRRRVAAWFVGVLAVASAIECAVLYDGDGTRAYFGTDTRAQALLIGALLALVLLRVPQGHSRLLQLAGWCGIAFLFYVFVSQKPDAWIYHGGFFAVAVASALLIAAVTHSQGAPLARVLASPPFVAVGLISYGLYLYHLPVFLWLTPSSTHLDGLQLLGLRVLVTCAIALASYHLIEKRFTRRRGSERQPIGGLIVAGTLVLALIIAATPSNVPPLPSADTISYALRLAAEQTPSGLPRAMVVGDEPVIDLAVRSPGLFEGDAIRGAPYAMKNCDIVQGDSIDEAGITKPPPLKCLRQAHNLHEVVTAFRPASVVLMLGPTDARDRVVLGKRIGFRSQQYRALVATSLDRARAAVNVGSARFILLPVRCDASGPVPQTRINGLNQILADYAREHPDVAFESSAARKCTSASPTIGWTWEELQGFITAR